ncbi:cell cycle family protein [Mycobacterium xenopi 4042]|uniref:Probable peptidoglycan glycosyltransferase FtsW n=1 Tax=Mycobacterium xenopi 4042 TaxID=1299334 RepID=X7ZZD7_MYCXE|nr:cell cycle family protein [Mycobacterium xenopi 4042]
MQPSELTKIAFAIWGAHLLAARRMERASLREMLIPLVPAAVIALALIVAQPDLGQTVSLGIILLALLWYAGLPLRVFVSSLFAVIVSGAILAVSEGYRSDRVRSWLNPGQDPQDTGYQARQAKFALANGGIFGHGLGQGTAKWNYLPNAHNDFIFAIIGEELGFVGAFALLALFGLFAYTGMRIARRSTDPFLRLLTATTTMWVIGQVFINVGYVIGLLPITGLQLPLISAGGTSTATTLLMIGVMANAARHEPEAVAALRAGRDDRMNRLLRLPLPEPYTPSRWRRCVTGCALERNRSRGNASPTARPRHRGGAIGKTRTTHRPARHSGIMEGVSATPGSVSHATGGLVHWKVSIIERLGHSARRTCPAVGRPRRWRHGRSRRARHGRRRRADGARSAGADHRTGHTARAGDQAGARAGYRLELITPFRCRVSSAPTWPGCRPG